MSKESCITKRNLSLSLKSIVVLVGCVLLCSGACAALLTCIHINFIKNPVYSYSVVFDAGSSHTHMMIFRWLANKSNGRGNTALIEEIYSNESEPGISSIPSHNSRNLQKAIRKYFHPFINELNLHIPKNRRRDAVILLGATAGMRLRSITDPKSTELLLDFIRKCFRAHGYLIKHDSIRIITGVEEAVSAWISVNALSDRVKPRRNVPEPFGALDLGGASTQIAFVTNKDNSFLDSHNIYLFGHKYSIAAYSFLCLGKNEIRKHFDYKLISDNFKVNKILDPCSLKGTSRTISLLELNSEPCSLGLSFDRWRKPNNDDYNRFYKIIGLGEPEQCFQMIQSILTRQCISNSYCFINGTNHILQFDPNMKFIGFSAFFFVWNNLNQPKSTNEYLTRLQRACRKTINETIEEKGSTSIHYQNICFDGWYVYVLLKTYGFDNMMQEANIERFRKLNGKSVGWAYGFMINHTNMMPEEYPQLTKFHLMSNIITMSLLWVIAFLCSLLFLLLCCKIKTCEK